MRPPERLVDGDLVLRPYTQADIPALATAVTESLEHLKPWMAWAHDGIVEQDWHEFIERSRASWEAETDFGYGILLDGEAAGGCGIHRRGGPDSVDIGYWVHVDHIGHGLATRASRMLTTAAFDSFDITHVDITHARDNVRSARVPEKLGYECLGDEPEGAPCDVRWRMTRERWSERR